VTDHLQLALSLKTAQNIDSHRVLSTPFKVFEGISREEASSESFRAAILISVAEALGVPAESVTLYFEFTRRNKRSLLSSVSLTYVASVTSGMSGDVLLAKLNGSMEEGTYLALVKERSGLPISGMTGIVLSDITPTARPVSEPTASPFQLGTLPNSTYLH
jgi:hypothetical protein